MRALKTTWPRGPHRPGGPRGRGSPAKPSALGIAFVAAALLAPAAGGAGRLVARHASTLAGTQAYTLDLDLQAAPKIAGAHIGTFQQAVRTFGEPTLASATVMTAPACKAVWPRLGLEIDFAATAAASCSAPLLGRWLNVVATAPRWHTTAGLRVGDTENRLRVLYPRTRPLDFLGLGPLVQLKTGGPYCDGGPPLALAARIHFARVEALAIVRVPACG